MLRSNQLSYHAVSVVAKRLSRSFIGKLPRRRSGGEAPVPILYREATTPFQVEAKRLSQNLSSQLSAGFSGSYHTVSILWRSACSTFISFSCCLCQQFCLQVHRLSRHGHSAHKQRLACAVRSQFSLVAVFVQNNLRKLLS